MWYDDPDAPDDDRLPSWFVPWVYPIGMVIFGVVLLAVVFLR